MWARASFPLGHLRKVRAHARTAPSAAALEALLAHGDVETGLAQSRRERAEGLPDERFRSHPTAPLLEVRAVGMRPSSAPSSG